MKLLKIPLNAGGLSKKDGSQKGPEAVLEVIDQFYLSEAGMMPIFEEVDVQVDNANLEEAHKAILDAVVKTEGYCVLLGGDHSLTYPAFKAFARKHPGAGIIVLDAHPDVQEFHQPPTHEDYLRVLIDEGVLDSDRVVLLGTRNQSAEEMKYIAENRIKNYTSKEISFEGLRDTVDAAMSVARQWPAVYLSVDIDVLDCAFAPGTGYPEPGGLTTRELIYTVQRLKLLKNLKMADLVEVNPDKDIDSLTTKAAAKVIVELF